MMPELTYHPLTTLDPDFSANRLKTPVPLSLTKLIECIPDIEKFYVPKCNEFGDLFHWIDDEALSKYYASIPTEFTKDGIPKKRDSPEQCRKHAKIANTTMNTIAKLSRIDIETIHTNLCSRKIFELVTFIGSEMATKFTQTSDLDINIFLSDQLTKHEADSAYSIMRRVLKESHVVSIVNSQFIDKKNDSFPLINNIDVFVWSINPKNQWSVYEPLYI